MSPALAVPEHSWLCHSHQAAAAVAWIDCVRYDDFKDPNSGHPRSVTIHFSLSARVHACAKAQRTKGDLAG